MTWRDRSPYCPARCDTTLIFFQTSQPRLRRTPDTGLGLALSTNQIEHCVDSLDAVLDSVQHVEERPIDLELPFAVHDDRSDFPVRCVVADDRNGRPRFDDVVGWRVFRP